MNMIKKLPDALVISMVKDISDRCASMGGPICCEINKLVQAGLFKEVADFSIAYSYESNLIDLKYARQILALFQKQCVFDFGVDRKAVAIDSFIESETKCQIINLKFRRLTPCEGESPLSRRTNAILHYASRKISACLGDVPSIDELDLVFGPGANTSVKSSEANIRVKLSRALSCSLDFLEILKPTLESVPSLVEYCKVFGIRSLALAKGKLTTVPKSAKTDRCIMIEPPLNGLVQKGIGRFIRNRLARVGIDLRNQEVNRSLALRGSVDNSLATVDLRAASDSISYGLVLDLLPFPWFCLLNACRTGSVVYKGCTIHLEKFSSMGNGFTFELETLIFWAISSSVIDYLEIEDRTLSVYGDDIIIPSAAYDVLKETFEDIGFTVNTDKSYSNGPFRESCGADFFLGQDIRPFYLRDRVDGFTLYKMHNFFIRNCEPDLAAMILNYLPKDELLYGPDGYGDGHLIGTFIPRVNRRLFRMGYEGYFFDTYVNKAVKFSNLQPGDYLLPVYSIYVKGIGKPVPDSVDLDYLSPSEPSDYDDLRGCKGYKKVSLYTTARGILYP